MVVGRASVFALVGCVNAADVGPGDSGVVIQRGSGTLEWEDDDR
jgi:hypothetical protein